MIWLFAVSEPIPHDSVEFLQALSILFAVEEWALGAGTPDLSSHRLQAVTQLYSYKPLQYPPLTSVRLAGLHLPSLVSLLV